MMRRGRARVLGNSRQKRYTDLRALKTAVRAACIAYVESRAVVVRIREGERSLQAGAPADEMVAWTDDLARTIGESLAVDEEAHRLCMGLRRALREAAIFLHENPTAGDGHADEMRRVVRAVEPLVTTFSEGKLYTRRQLLVAQYNRRGARMWWSNRDPTLKDLAVLSLLTGPFPAAIRKRLSDGSALTVHEVIQAEERAIGNERRKGY